MNRRCVVDGCQRRYGNGGYCWTHYNQLRKRGGVFPITRTPSDESLEQRLARFFVAGDERECWTWTGPTARGAYGLLKIKGKLHRAHREVYRLLVGEIPDGLTLDHLCRNTLCVNPQHLEPVTRQVNSKRQAVALHRSECLRGHLYTPENTYVNKRGCRSCKTCRAAAIIKHRAKNAVPGYCS